MSRSIRAFAGALSCCAALWLTVGAGPAPAGETGRPLVAHDLATLDRVADPRLSPDGRRVIFDLRTTDYAANAGRHAVWIADLTQPDAAPRRLEATARWDGTSARWSPDGAHIYFLSSRSGSSQIWRADIAGNEAVQATDLPLDVSAFRVSPDGRTVVVALAVLPGAEDPAATAARQAAPATQKASGRVYDRLFARHWDAWSDGARSHLFALAADAGGLFAGKPVPLMAGFDGDTPVPPFGDDNDWTITADSAAVIFSAKKAGASEAWSTHAGLWRAPMDGSAPPRELTAGHAGGNGAPVISPDGRWLAWEAQKRAGYESDRQGVWVMNLVTGAEREVDPAGDYSADALAWSPDGRSLLLTAAQTQQNPLFAVDPATGARRNLTGAGTVEGFSAAGRTLVWAQSSLEHPSDLWVSVGGDPPRRITHFNDARLAEAAISRAEPFAFAGWNGETVHGFVVRPPGYQAGRTYPAVLMLHGGPESAIFNSWSYRWNPQVWAGWGYVVVTIDYHGSTGYGQAFTDAIDGHWGDRPLEDVRKGWAAALKAYPFIDPNRACAAGASFGGYLVYWMESHLKSPWRCLIAHDGVFDTTALGTATEELWFTEWEFGGAAAEHPEAYERFNPARFISDWTTPTLVIHSGLDFRVPVDQGLSAFTVLQRQGTPSRFLTFPDENHWVLKPQNSVQWHDTVKDWLDRWTR